MPLFTVPLEATSLNLKTFLQQHKISATTYKACKRQGLCQINGQIVQRNVLLSPGDTVCLTFPPEDCQLETAEGDLAIIYEDDYFLVVNKPAGLLVHPTGQEKDSLANRLAAYSLRKERPFGIHPVLRLDQETSGLVLFAKNSAVQYALTQTPLAKEYLALTHGCPPSLSGTITAPIGRKPGSIIERQVDAKGQAALTYYHVLATNNRISLIKFSLGTGRTHQIRVHSAFLGCPLIGDHLYGAPGTKSRHFLHAYKLKLTHPFTNEALAWELSLPPDMLDYMEKENLCYNKYIKNFRR